MNGLEGKIKDISDRVNRTLESCFSQTEATDANLLEAIQYSMFSGGKRLRPCVLVMFYELCGGGGTGEIYKAACALEMIHTYSLIHDDLPCMDNDEMRRGKKCAHVVYGEDMALLAGDALITRAFELLFGKSVIEKFGYKAVLDAAKVLSASAGAMVSGQAMDIRMDKSSFINKELLLDMYSKKTGALFRAAAEIGAILSGADSHKTDHAGVCGEYFGIAFQLYDDIKDIDQDDKNKVSYVSIYGEAKTKCEIGFYMSEAMKILSEFGNNSKFLAELMKATIFN